MHAPILRGSGLVADTLERNPHFDFVAVVREVALRFEDEIGTQVGRSAAAANAAEPAVRLAGSFDERAVHLNAERVRAEHAGLPPVVERAQEDLHPVVVVDVIAIAERGADAAGRGMGAHAEIDRAGRIPNQDLRLVTRGTPVIRRVLGESGQSGRLQPHGLGQASVHLDGGIDAGNIDPKIPLGSHVNLATGSNRGAQQ